MTKINVTDGKSKEPKAVKKTAKKAPVRTMDFRRKPATKKTVKKTAHPVSISSSATHSTVQKSTTLSRRYVKRPVVTHLDAEEPALIDETEFVEVTTNKAAKRPKPAKVEKPTKAEKPAKATPIKIIKPAKLEKPTKPEKPAKLAKKHTALKQGTGVKPASKAPKIIKKRAISDRALKSATKSIKSIEATPKDAPVQMQKAFKKRGKGRRIFLALICSGAAVGALVAFVHFCIPDISVRVAAIQTGIEATYPTFIPRNYSLVNVTSDKDGIVTMFFDGPDGASFSLSEEKSTWDSTALLNNYVKKTYPADFTTLREQGITIYVRGEKASWVNGGLLYKITATGKNLTKEQVKNIATSL